MSYVPRSLDRLEARTFYPDTKPSVDLIHAFPGFLLGLFLALLIGPTIIDGWGEMTTAGVMGAILPLVLTPLFAPFAVHAFRLTRHQAHGNTSAKYVRVSARTHQYTAAVVQKLHEAYHAGVDRDVVNALLFALVTACESLPEDEAMVTPEVYSDFVKLVRDIGRRTDEAIARELEVQAPLKALEQTEAREKYDRESRAASDRLTAAIESARAVTEAAVEKQKYTELPRA